MRLFFLLITFLASLAMATHVAVLETIADASVKDNVQLSDRQYLTNVLRERAVMELPVEQNFTIMTRENINAMLPPGKSIEECEGSCLAETGKNISADYVCQARIGSFDGAFTLSAELYETAGNKLVASFNGQGASVKELLEIVKEKSPNFFRKIKNSGGFAGVGGIGEVSGAGEYSFAGKKKYIIEIITSPSGAIPTIDGKGIPKCTSTPCKVQVEEGNHRFVATRERYDDAEMVVDISENNQKVELALEPNFGWLEVNPMLGGSAVSKGVLSVMVDGKFVNEKKILLDPGIHNVRVSHPCYDPAEFKVSIAKNKTEVFDKTLPRGKGGLELNVEYKGEPQAVTVLIDGVEAGSTPYVGEVPLCAEVVLKGNDWSEKVVVTPKWHEVVQKTHKLQHTPESVVLAEDTTRAKAQAAYDELDGKPSAYVGESVPTNVKQEESKTAKWVVLGISSTVAVTGIVLAVAGNSQAKDAREKSSNSEESFQKRIDDAKSGQRLRDVGIGLAIAGAVGIGVSFAF